MLKARGKEVAGFRITNKCGVFILDGPVGRKESEG